MSDNFQLNLGSLRSSINLTLHTHHAARIWHGRPASNEAPAIIGLSGFVGIMNRLKRGAEQDDPYSDWWMIRIEEKLEQSKQEILSIHEQLDSVMAALPKALSVSDNLNVHPVTIPLFVNAQLGFLAVYLLVSYDDLVRRVLLANHTALITRRDMEAWIDQGAHALRSLFGLAQQYKFSGASRDDFAANNARAIKAREQFGDLPQDILEGTRRSSYAPPITRKKSSSGLADSNAGHGSADAENEG
ncbi:PFL_4669 family integrating conjugative element protein [Azotobacter salinestris]|uniref:PFL_4669 family integrating conjugative element protein n=1 Tax=Azotobacter salinestris TaxID=69964 RepID=UPI0032E02606